MRLRNANAGITIDPQRLDIKDGTHTVASRQRNCVLKAGSSTHESSFLLTFPSFLVEDLHKMPVVG